MEGLVKWWMWVPQNYRKDRDLYDGTFKALGLLKGRELWVIPGWEWGLLHRDWGKLGSCWDHTWWSCCHSVVFFFPLSFPALLFSLLVCPGFFLFWNEQEMGEVPKNNEGVYEFTKHSQICVSCLKHSPVSLVGYALLLLFSCILVAANWVWSACPVR